MDREGIHVYVNPLEIGFVGLKYGRVDDKVNMFNSIATFYSAPWYKAVLINS